MTTSQDIEREAEESRAQLSSTLEQLRERLTPGQLLDEVMSGSSAGASAFVKNLGTTVRDNPVPSVLIGAGLLMMMTGTTGLGMISGGRSSRETSRYDEDDFESTNFRSYQDDGRDRRLWTENGTQPYGSRAAGSRSYGRSDEDDGQGLMDRAGEALGSAADSVRSIASGAAERVSAAASSVTGAASDMGERASDMWESTADAAGRATSSLGEGADEMGERTGQWTDRARHFASDMTDQVSGAVRSATDRTMQMNRQMRGTVSQMIDEQPLLVGVVGLAIGAALGAVLPSTRVENRLMGDTADRFKDTATGFASEQYEHAKDVAGDVVQQVRQEAEAQGLSLDQAKDKARDIAGEIGSKVQAVASKAQDAVAERVPDVAGEGRDAKDGKHGGEAGVRSPQDPVHRRDEAKQGGGQGMGSAAGAGQGGASTGAGAPGAGSKSAGTGSGTGVGSGSSSSSAGTDPKGPSPAAAQPSVVSTPPTGPGSSAGKSTTPVTGPTSTAGPGPTAGSPNRPG